MKLNFQQISSKTLIKIKVVEDFLQNKNLFVNCLQHKCLLRLVVKGIVMIKNNILMYLNFRNKVKKKYKEFKIFLKNKKDLII